MDFHEVIKSIELKKYRPIYLLHGEESYFIDKLSEYIENNILTPEQKDFNCTIFYGADAQPQDIIDACRRYPVFAQHQVVVLREAQHMKILREAREFKELERLEAYFANPVQTTILVLCYKNGKFDARKKNFKLIKENGVIFESQSMKESQIPSFIDKYLKRKNAAIDEKARSLLVDYIGTDLSRITNELDKLWINIPHGSKITSRDIEKNIGISKDYNVFELQTALLTKNAAKAFTIVKYLNENSKANPFVLTLANIHAAYQKLFHYLVGGSVSDNDLYRLYGIHYSQAAAYREAQKLYNLERVEEIFGITLEYDLRSKGVNNGETSSDELLKELVYKIME
jgi:DNA polymerase-3 subunit delta